MQQPVAQIGKQPVSQINLMMVSCVLNTSWGKGEFAVINAGASLDISELGRRHYQENFG